MLLLVVRKIDNSESWKGQPLGQSVLERLRAGKPVSDTEVNSRWLEVLKMDPRPHCRRLAGGVTRLLVKPDEAGADALYRSLVGVPVECLRGHLDETLADLFRQIPEDSARISEIARLLLENAIHREVFVFATVLLGHVGAPGDLELLIEIAGQHDFQATALASISRIFARAETEGMARDKILKREWIKPGETPCAVIIPLMREIRLEALLAAPNPGAETLDIAARILHGLTHDLAERFDDPDFGRERPEAMARARYQHLPGGAASLVRFLIAIRIDDCRPEWVQAAAGIALWTVVASGGPERGEADLRGIAALAVVVLRSPHAGPVVSSGKTPMEPVGRTPMSPALAIYRCQCRPVEDLIGGLDFWNLEDLIEDGESIDVASFAKAATTPDRADASTDPETAAWMQARESCATTCTHWIDIANWYVFRFPASETAKSRVLDRAVTSMCRPDQARELVYLARILRRDDVLDVCRSRLNGQLGPSLKDLLVRGLLEHDARTRDLWLRDAEARAISAEDRKACAFAWGLAGEQSNGDRCLAPLKFRRALDPKLAETWWHLGFDEAAASEAGRIHRALDAQRFGIGPIREEAGLWVALAQLNKRLGQSEDAIARCLHTGVHTANLNATQWPAVLRGWMACGGYSFARTLFDGVLPMIADDGPLMIEFARVALELGEADRAQGLLDEGLELLRAAPNVAEPNVWGAAVELASWLDPEGCWPLLAEMEGMIFGYPPQDHRPAYRSLIFTLDDVSEPDEVRRLLSETEDWWLAWQYGDLDMASKAASSLEAEAETATAHLDFCSAWIALDQIGKAREMLERCEGIVDTLGAVRDIADCWRSLRDDERATSLLSRYQPMLRTCAGLLAMGQSWAELGYSERAVDQIARAEDLAENCHQWTSCARGRHEAGDKDGYFAAMARAEAAAEREAAAEDHEQNPYGTRINPWLLAATAWGDFGFLDRAQACFERA